MIVLGALVVASTALARLALVVTRAAQVRGRVVETRGERWRPPSLRRPRPIDEQLPDALDAIARSLRSGASLPQAIGETARASRGEVGRDLTEVSAAVDRGEPLAAALHAWGEMRATAGVRLASAAIALGAESGGAAARAIDGVANTLRTNLAIAGEVRALSAQARLSALVIVLAPVGFTLFTATTDAGTLELLLTTPLGIACLAVGGGLDLVGWLWMRRLTSVQV